MEQTIVKPPVEGVQSKHYDGRYRLWTVNDVPYGTFPAYGDGGPATVAHTPWCVSYRTLCRALSSPSVVAADDGRITLGAFRVISDTPYQSEKHELDGTRYDTDDDARRVAYEAGLTAYMVYLKDEERYGIA